MIAKHQLESSKNIDSMQRKSWPKLIIIANPVKPIFQLYLSFFKSGVIIRFNNWGEI